MDKLAGLFINQHEAVPIGRYRGKEASAKARPMISYVASRTLSVVAHHINGA